MGELMMRALLFGSIFAAADFWKLPCKQYLTWGLRAPGYMGPRVWA